MITATSSPRKTANTEVSILGGGLIGIASALRLQQAGHRCVLIDPMQDGQAASWGNAGHIATEQIAPLASWATIRSLPRRWFARGGAVDVPKPWSVLPWMLRFLRAAKRSRHAAGVTALRGLLADAIPAWQRLLSSIDQSELLRIDGHIVLWESPAAAQRGRADWLGSDIGTASARALSANELQRYAMLIGKPLVDGICFAGTAQIAELNVLINSMRDAFVAAGGQRLQGMAKLKLQDNKAIVTLDGKSISSDHILVAAGVGSAQLMASVGEFVPLITERGYHLHWPDHDWPSDAPPVVFEDRSVILTRFDNGLRLAGFVEFVPPGIAPDPRKWQRLQAHAIALGLPVRGVAQQWSGARPTLPDYLPAIGRGRKANNLLYAFGHQHLGLTLAATTAERVLSLLDHGPVPANPFDLMRF